MFVDKVRITVCGGRGGDGADGTSGCKTRTAEKKIAPPHRPDSSLVAAQ